MAKYLRIFWGTFAFLLVVVMVVVAINIPVAAEQRAADADEQNLNFPGSERNPTVESLLVVFIGLTAIVLCGLPLFLLSLYLVWRNGVKIRNDRIQSQMLAETQSMKQIGS